MLLFLNDEVDVHFTVSSTTVIYNVHPQLVGAATPTPGLYVPCHVPVTIPSPEQKETCLPFRNDSIDPPISEAEERYLQIEVVRIVGPLQIWRSFKRHCVHPGDTSSTLMASV